MSYSQSNQSYVFDNQRINKIIKRKLNPNTDGVFNYYPAIGMGDLSSPGNLLIKEIICDTNNLPTVILTLVRKILFTGAPK